MFNMSRTSLAGLITILSSIASAFLLKDYSSAATAIVTGLGLIAAKDQKE